MDTIDEQRMRTIKAAAVADILNSTRRAILKTIQEELWPLMGQFKEIDDEIDGFEKRIRELKL